MLGETIRASHALVQPVAADDVASTLSDIVLGKPLNSTIELAGPELIHLDELIRLFLVAHQDKRKVVTDAHALYYGLELDDQSLTPEKSPHLGETHFKEWLKRSLLQV